MPDPIDPNSIPQTAEDIAKANDAARIQKDLANEYADALTKIGTSAAESGKYINLLAIATTGSSKAFEGFGANVDRLTSFTTQLGVLEKAGSLAINSLQAVAASAGLGSKAFSMGADSLMPFIKNLAAAADDTINFQQGYLGMAAAAGGLNKVFQDSGTNLNNINEVMRSHQVTIHSIADSTHSTADEVGKFATLLGTSLPTAFTNQINVTDASGRSLSALEATMALARGTGRSVADITKDMTTAYEDFNMRGNEALEWTARMTDLSSKFNIPLSYTEGFLKENANAFAMLSDKVGTADVTFNRMFESLKNTGLSAKQSVAIISEMETGLSKLTTTQKAFLSAQGGGPGGLRGAAHIDNLIREGRTDEVMKMAEDNLRKHFGGRIYTQKEAEGSDFAASQFYKQQQMVKSGAFGSLVKDDAAATRVLEAMKAGTNTKDALKDTQNVLQGAVGQGQQLQQTTNTILLDLLHAVQEGKSMGGYTTLNALQKNIGSTVRDDRSESGEYRANLLRDAENRSIKNTADTNIRIQNNKPIANIEDLSATNLKRAGNTISSMLPPEIRKKLEEYVNNMGSSSNDQNNNFSATMQMLEAERSKFANKIKQNKGTEQDKIQLENYTRGEKVLTDIHNQETGRGMPISHAVNNAQALAGRARVEPAVYNAGDHENKSGRAQPNNKSEVVVTIKGVVCEDCHKPIRPSTHAEIIDQGSFHK